MVTKMETERTTQDVERLAKPQEGAATAPMTVPTEPVKKKKGFLVPLVLTSIVVGIVGCGAYFYMSAREETDDAYVDAHISNISSKVAGNVLEVRVNDNENVKSGQILVKLDPIDYDVKVAQYNANVEQAKFQALASQSRIGMSAMSAEGQNTQANATVTATEADIESAKSALAQAQTDIKQQRARIVEIDAQLQYAKSDFERYKAVFEQRAVKKQDYDKARQAIQVSDAQREGAVQALEMAQQKEIQARSQLNQVMQQLKRSHGGVTSALASIKQTEIDKQQYASAIANVKKAEADLKQSKLQQSYTTILAPVSGRVGHKAVEVGQHIEVGQVLMAVVQEDPWITANFKETQVGRMHRGQPVEVKIDSFPGQVFKAYVDSMAPASGAKFSMLPPDNASGNFTKVVQRIPVKLIFDQKSMGEYKGRIAPGMSCIVTVLVHEKDKQTEDKQIEKNEKE
jgi:membrane fusion protein (multidrug efflux system)